MTQLKLIPNPTFTVRVAIPVAGGPAVPVIMTFRHRTKDDMHKFLGVKGRSDTKTFLEMVTGWELEDEFNQANVELLLSNYHGAALATFRTYIAALTQTPLPEVPAS